MPFPIIPVVVGVIAGIGFLVSGCGSTDEKKPDAAPPSPPQKPNCDTFTRQASLGNVDSEAFNAFNYLWPNQLDKAHLANWDRHARIYAGATDGILKPVCEQRVQGNQQVQQYTKASTGFFESFYSSPGKASDDGILVLFAGFAPLTLGGQRLDRAVIDGAMEAFGAANPSQKPFAELVKAVRLFNEATEKADPVTRYSSPRAGAAMTKADRDSAKALLDQMDGVLKGISENALNDLQREWLVRLIGAAAAYRKTLVGGGKPPCVGPKCGSGGTGGSGGGGGVKLPENF